MPFYVYILQSEKDGSYYTGSTQNLKSRLVRHNQGRSKFTKIKRSWKLIYSEEHPDRSSAVQRENQIKQQKRWGFIKKIAAKSEAPPAMREEPHRFSLQITNVYSELKSNFSNFCRKISAGPHNDSAMLNMKLSCPFEKN